MLTRTVVRRAQPCLLRALGARGVATEKEMRKKIATTTDIEKITSSMKLVAASKMMGDIKRFQAAEPFGEIFTRLSTVPEDFEDSEETKSSNKTTLIVCNSSDRGLCGGINSSIGKAVRFEADALEKAGGVARIAIVGEKGKSQLKRLRGSEVDVHFSECVLTPITFSTAAAVAENLINSDVDEFNVLHQHFISQIAYEPKHNVIPNLNAGRKSEDGSVPDLVPAHLSGYNFEPECKPEALANLTEFQLAGTMYVASVDGTASEQTSRRAAMDNASSNAADMIEKFTMQYNRIRQAKITTELTEIVSGAEALNDSE